MCVCGDPRPHSIILIRTDSILPHPHVVFLLCPFFKFIITQHAEIISANRMDSRMPYETQAGFPNKNVRPNQSDVEMTYGFMRSYTLMYAAEAQLTGEDKMQNLKDTILKDCELRINSSATISCSAIGTVLAIELKKDDGLQATASYNIFLFCMMMSCILGMTCMVDNISYASFYNMVPASFICEARYHTSTVARYDSKQWFHTSRVLSYFGLDDRAFMFFVSTSFLFVGIFAAIYNQYGFDLGTWTCLFVCTLCLYHMLNTSLGISKYEFPKFADKYAEPMQIATRRGKTRLGPGFEDDKSSSFLTNAGVASILAASGNLVSNYLKDVPLDWTDALVWAILAFFYITPILMVYYDWLARRNWSKFQKLAVDQLLVSPIFMFGLLVAKDIILHIYQDSLTIESLYFFDKGAIWAILPGIMKANWLFWVPARFVVLNYVDPSFHILGGNVLSFIWQVILGLL